MTEKNRGTGEQGETQLSLPQTVDLDNLSAEDKEHLQWRMANLHAEAQDIVRKEMARWMPPVQPPNPIPECREILLSLLAQANGYLSWLGGVIDKVRARQEYWRFTFQSEDQARRRRLIFDEMTKKIAEDIATCNVTAVEQLLPFIGWTEVHRDVLVAKLAEYTPSDANDRLLVHLSEFPWADEIELGFVEPVSLLQQQILEGLGGTQSGKPIWLEDRGELHLNGKVIRKVKRLAKNVIAVLETFQELDWPVRIDDPLPGGADSLRLNETVRSLNDGLEMIRFCADGTGKGFKWDFLKDSHADSA